MRTEYDIKLNVLVGEVRKDYTLATAYEGEDVEAALEYGLEYLKEQGFEFKEIKKDLDKKYSVLYTYKDAFIHIEERCSIYLIEAKDLLK